VRLLERGDGGNPTAHRPTMTRGVVSRRVAAAAAAAAVAAALHLAAAPAHASTPLPIAVLAHPTTTRPTESTARPTDRHRSATVEPDTHIGGVVIPPTAADPSPGEHERARRDAALLAWGFTLAGGYGLWAAWRLLRLPPTGRLPTFTWATIVGGHAAMLAAGLASRTVGLLGHTDPWWEVAFLLALAGEAIVVVACWPLRRTPAELGSG
jgi:hypothetical protein